MTKRRRGNVVDPMAVVTRFIDAANHHDVDALRACVHREFESIQPIHPGRNFRGAGQLISNWKAIFEAEPGFRLSVRRAAVTDDTVWVEVHGAGASAEAAGIFIVGIEDDRIRWIRVYSDLVEPAPEPEPEPQPEPEPVVQEAAAASTGDDESDGAGGAHIRLVGDRDADADVDVDATAGTSEDAGAVDGGAVDGGAVDGGAVDGGAVDAGAVDAGAVDAGAVGGVEPVPALKLVEPSTEGEGDDGAGGGTGVDVHLGTSAGAPAADEAPGADTSIWAERPDEVADPTVSTATTDATGTPAETPGAPGGDDVLVPTEAPGEGSGASPDEPLSGTAGEGLDEITDETGADAPPEDAWTTPPPPVIADPAPLTKREEKHPWRPWRRGRGD